MCRLLLMNKQAEKEIEKIYGLEKYLTYLEKQLGGHGNGYLLVKDRKIISYCKGIELTTKEIANKFKRIDYDWAIFHTRLATIGEKNDKNCHPFLKKGIALAMNGTESSVKFVSDTTKMTDTESILDLIVKYNLGVDVLQNFNSIFVGIQKGKPFVVANDIVRMKILKNNYTKALAFASTFPNEFEKNIFEPVEPFFWNGGKIPVKLEKRKKRIYRSIYYDYLFDADGQEYLFEKEGA